MSLFDVFDNGRFVSGLIQNGIMEANRTYAQWSGGYWLCDAGVESIMLAHVADSIGMWIAGNDDLFLHVEGTFKYFYETENDARRADIILSDANCYPLAHIELKRSEGDGDIRADARKIRDVFKMAGFKWRPQLSFMGLYLSWNARQDGSLDDCITAKKTLVESELNGFCIDWEQSETQEVEWHDAGETVLWRCCALVATIAPNQRPGSGWRLKRLAVQDHG